MDHVGFGDLNIDSMWTLSVIRRGRFVHWVRLERVRRALRRAVALKRSLYLYLVLGPGFGISNTPDQSDRGVH